MKIIGISGVATSGKDTLCNLIGEHLSNRNIKTKRIALADKLKEDLFPFIKEKFNINIFDVSSENKTLIRPILVSYGRIKRTISKGKHWTSLVDETINNLIATNIVPIITDVRYDEYPEDELYWLKNKNGILIHISRKNTDGTMVPPANSEEESNDIRLKELADIKYVWDTESKMCALYQKHIDLLEEIYERIK